MVRGRSIPFLPLLELLRDLFDVSEREEPHSARRKVAGELTLLGEGLRDLLPLVFEFLGVAEPDQPPLDLPPDVRKEQLFAFVQHLIRSRAEREPPVPQGAEHSMTVPAPSGKKGSVGTRGGVGGPPGRAGTILVEQPAPRFEAGERGTWKS